MTVLALLTGVFAADQESDIAWCSACGDHGSNHGWLGGHNQGPAVHSGGIDVN